MDIMILANLNASKPDWLLALSVLIALLSCFLGYRLLKIWTTLVGALLGALIGYFAVISYVNNVGIAILTGLLGGLLIGFIAFKLYLLGVFLVAAVWGFFIYLRIPLDENLPQMLVLGVGAVLAVIIGVLAVKFARPTVIVVTAVSGGMSGTADLFALLHYEQVVWILVAGAAVTAAGLAVQFMTTRKRGRS